MRKIIDDLPDEIDSDKLLVEVVNKNIEEDDVYFDIFFAGVMERVKSGEIDTLRMFKEVIKEPIPVYKAVKDEY